MKPEMLLQIYSVRWLEMQDVLFCASAGGMRTSMRTAINMKMMGYKKGFPDIFIYEPRGKYHGLAIELKVRTRPTPEQQSWQELLNAKGYKALIMPSSLDLTAGLEWFEKEVGNYLKGGQV